MPTSEGNIHALKKSFGGEHRGEKTESESVRLLEKLLSGCTRYSGLGYVSLTQVYLVLVILILKSNISPGRMRKLCWFTLAFPSLFLLAALSEADAKPSLQQGKGSCSVVEYWSASSQGSCSYILPNPRPFSVGKSELEVCVNNEVSANSCNTTKTGVALLMLPSGPGTHNTTSDTEYLTATPHAISDTANKFTIIRMGCCNSSTPKGEGNIKSLVPEAVSTGNITLAATFIFWFVMGLGATASKSRLICPPLTVANITSTRQNVYFQYTLPYVDASDESINATSEKGGTLHVLISSWATTNTVNWFYAGTSTFFIVSEQVIPRLKPSGHIYSMSPDLYCSLAKLKNSSHMRKSVESILSNLSILAFEISTATNTLNKVEGQSGFSLSTKTQEYNYHRKTGTGYIPVPRISVFPIKLTLGLGLLCAFLMSGISGVYFSVKKHKFINLKAKFFQKNGGLLLEQHISSHGSPKFFSSEELKVAADYYNQIHTFSPVESGKVHKGLLSNGAIVAITETVVQEGQIGRFINEIVTLTKINHENVVKFLGCCLETEAPMLVYELACNGTLFDYVHHVNGKKTLPWHILLKIASESAAALAYLHSAAETSKPMIIHGNVNSSNILLSDCFVAKVFGFGSSRLVRDPSNESQMKTLVQQTVGYLDPEYLQSGQLTDKSDVYSFGVVLLELLTGEMPLSFNRPENRRIITSHFVSSVEQNDIFQIVVPQLVNEGNREQLRAVAELAKSCLKLSSAERPAMEEVAGELRRLCGSTHSS